MPQSITELNSLSQVILGEAFHVHTVLGPGLLESAYKECLFYRLTKSGLWVEKEKPMPLIFEDIRLDQGYRLDLLVENKIVIELKAVEAINDLHIAQTLTYFKIRKIQTRLTIKFQRQKPKERNQKNNSVKLCVKPGGDPLRATL
jgi:GxxExxY protein